MTAPHTGTVWSQTLVHLPFGELTGGYRLLYVDLDDGRRVLCRQAADAPAPAVDDRVTVQDAGDHWTLEVVA